MRHDVDAIDLVLPEAEDDVLALDEALTQLQAADATAAELVRLRFFAGLPIPEVAQVMGISPRTADRLWAYARAWLHQEPAWRAATLNPIWRDLIGDFALMNRAALTPAAHDYERTHDLHRGPGAGLR